MLGDRVPLTLAHAIAGDPPMPFTDAEWAALAEATHRYPLSSRTYPMPPSCYRGGSQRATEGA